MKDFYIIVAVDQANGIGKNSQLPWHLSDELQYFKKITTETSHEDNLNMVVMGRNTWESIPPKYRPLKGRNNIVLSHDRNYKPTGAIVCADFDEIWQHADDNIEKIFVIGGAALFSHVINHPNLKGVYLTKIDQAFDCDVFFPPLPPAFKYSHSLGHGEDGDVKYEFQYYDK